MHAFTRCWRGNGCFGHVDRFYTLPATVKPRVFATHPTFLFVGYLPSSVSLTTSVDCAVGIMAGLRSDDLCDARFFFENQEAVECTPHFFNLIALAARGGKGNAVCVCPSSFHLLFFIYAMGPIHVYQSCVCLSRMESPSMPFSANTRNLERRFGVSCNAHHLVHPQAWASSDQNDRGRRYQVAHPQIVSMVFSVLLSLTNEIVTMRYEFVESVPHPLCAGFSGTQHRL